jgi:menaquinone-dependent protoporphyrinogen oxidase
MGKILVTYATLAGSTAEVARVVGEEITNRGWQADVLPLEQVKSIEAYDGIVVGAPMIMGWHRGALGFLKKHRQAFRRVPLAVFVMAMSLTKTDIMSVDGVQTCVDEKLPKPPAVAGKLNFRERYATVANYARPIIGAVSPAKPKSLAFFGGRLEYGRLPWWAVLFAMVIIQAPAGEKRNWEAIRPWARTLPDILGVANP